MIPQSLLTRAATASATALRPSAAPVVRYHDSTVRPPNKTGSNQMRVSGAFPAAVHRLCAQTPK
jgi:hypothetical protein